jgi:hypothetical protein
VVARASPAVKLRQWDVWRHELYVRIIFARRSIRTCEERPGTCATIQKVVSKQATGRITVHPAFISLNGG